ncbi:MAG: multicopper oxidase family protein [Marmoricola sp.]
MTLGAFGSAALLLPLERVARAQLLLNNRLPASALPKPFTIPYGAPPVVDLTGVPGGSFTKDGKPFLRVTMSQFGAEIIPGLTTPVWGYNGSAPGPTIRVKRGMPVVVRQVNRLPDRHPQLGYRPDTSVHLHGSASRPEFDGYANDLTKPGQYKDYEYPNIQNARTIWYHDHAVHHTASNVYMGLAAQYQLSDDEERALPLPKGRDFEGKEYDQPLIVQDAMFATDGSLIFTTNDDSGLFGDVILVNGRPWPVMKVERRKYRFRILNASVSRSYKLALSTGQPFTVIGTDSGLMPGPQTVASFRQAPAERYEVVLDFKDNPKGTRVVLQNLRPKNNIDYPTTGTIMAFDVVSDATDTTNNEVPELLNPDQDVMGLTAADAKATRRLDFVRKGGEWSINGKTWQDVVDSFTAVVASPTEDDVEVWELRNTSGGWFHPVHLHLVDFKILDRNGQPPLAHERGPKDVVYLGENETVRVVTRFRNQVGRYMIHCHNTVHEDHDMMTQFEVRSRAGDNGPDPIKAAPPKDLPEGPF